jgi:hypothetical protein
MLQAQQLLQHGHCTVLLILAVQLLLEGGGGRLLLLLVCAGGVRTLLLTAAGAWGCPVKHAEQRPPDIPQDAFGCMYCRGGCCRLYCLLVLYCLYCLCSRQEGAAALRVLECSLAGW